MIRRIKNKIQKTLHGVLKKNKFEDLSFLEHPFSLPEGETLESLYSYLHSYVVEFAPRKEMELYLGEDFKRFVHTLSLLPGKKGKLLEIGANPYYASLLIKKFTKYSLQCTNYFGDDSMKTSVQRMVSETEKPVVFKFDNFNVETAEFPYNSQSFDVVLMCEVIEHMTTDALGVLLKINKVLKTGGHLILSTPNVDRLENVSKLLAGSNIYDPYSGYGPYGRHNREFNKHELHHLLIHAGFEIEAEYTTDIHKNYVNNFYPVSKYWKLIEFRKHDLGQYLYFRVRKVKTVEAKKPTWLYRSYPSKELIDLQ